MSHLILFAFYPPFGQVKMAPKTAKRVRLSLKTKIEVIEKSASMSVPELMKKYGAGESTIYNIIERKSELTQQWLLSENPNTKLNKQQI